MKRVSQLTAALMLSGLAHMAFAAGQPSQMTFSNIQAQKGVVIDTRPSAFYNGWPQTVHGVGGHEPAALNLSASWLGMMNDEQLQGQNSTLLHQTA